MKGYNLDTDEGVKAFNNRTPVNSDGTPYNEAKDARFIKMFPLGIKENLFEIFDAFLTNLGNKTKQ